MLIREQVVVVLVVLVAVVMVVLVVAVLHGTSVFVLLDTLERIVKQVCIHLNMFELNLGSFIILFPHFLKTFIEKC
jgi:hypothetical protein